MADKRVSCLAGLRSPTPSRARDAHSGSSVGSLTAYSGGTVMASHHLPLTLSPVKLNLPPFRSVVPVSLLLRPRRWDTCRRGKTLYVNRYSLFGRKDRLTFNDARGPTCGSVTRGVPASGWRSMMTSQPYTVRIWSGVTTCSGAPA